MQMQICLTDIFSQFLIHNHWEPGIRGYREALARAGMHTSHGVAGKKTSVHCGNGITGVSTPSSTSDYL